MLDESVRAVSLTAPYGPAIVDLGTGDRIETITARLGVRRCHDRLGNAIPVLGECLRTCGVVSVIRPNRPAVIGSGARHTRELIVNGRTWGPNQPPLGESGCDTRGFGRRQRRCCGHRGRSRGIRLSVAPRNPQNEQCNETGARRADPRYRHDFLPIRCYSWVTTEIGESLLRRQIGRPPMRATRVRVTVQSRAADAELTWRLFEGSY